MGNDELGHSALPKLFGAPAYARPPVAPVNPVERPFDPDDLPLEAELTGEELDLVVSSPGGRTRVRPLRAFPGPA